MRLPISLVFVIGTGPLAAHSDPFGEKHPLVVVEAEGNFRVFYDYSDADFQSRMSFLLGENGKELIPRHRLSPSALQAFAIPAFGESVFRRIRLAPGHASVGTVVLWPEKAERQSLALTGGSDTGTSAKPAPPVLLPYDPIGFENLESFTITADHVAVITAVYPDANATRVTQMILRCCLKNGKKPGSQVALTDIGCIFDTPTASPPVWANGRFWIAWVQQRGPEETATWTTIITGLDPTTGKAEHHDLQGLSNWNTTVVLAANANGVLCAAWAASIDGSYPGRARVVTAVYPTKP